MSAYSDKVIADGASQYWRLGEASGPTAFNSIGGVNGTISGGVTLNQPGALADGNKAMTFDGATGKIVTAATVALMTPFTIEVWAKGTTAERPLYSTRNLVADSGAFVLLASAGGVYFFGVAGGSGATLRPILNGSWHHVVVVFHGTASLTVYTDGVAETVTGLTPAWAGAATHQFEIGHDSNGALFWPGALDEVAIYPLVLSPAQIANHYTLATTAPTLTGDRTTAWAYHLKPLAPPKNESERAALLGQGLSGGTAKDLTTLAAQFIDQG